MRHLRVSLYSLLLMIILGTGTLAHAQECFIGEVRWFGGNFAPRGWAVLEGQLLPINQNQALFAILGTQYGGDGRTTFGLPDLRGRSLLGKGQGPGLSNRRIGEKGGEERHRLTVQEMPVHAHEARGANVKGTEEFPGGNLIAGSNKGNSSAFVPRSKQITPLSPATIGPAGGNQFHDIMSPYAVLTPIMCLQGVFPSRN
ncbi:MAG: tail fiber protein [Nitrospirota bacterium]|nr:tail fiber protein [Nitrospirota bacterium]